jgi:hypothetical protein
VSANQILTVKLDYTVLNVTAAASPATSAPTNKKVKVTVSGTVSDALSGINVGSGTYSVVDNLGTAISNGNFNIKNGTYSFKVDLLASVPIKYIIIVRASDLAGNMGVANATFTVK